MLDRNHSYHVKETHMNDLNVFKKENQMNQKVYKNVFATLIALILFTGSAMASSCAYSSKKGSMASNQDIVDIAVSDKSFSTLVTALKAADLVNTLKGDGPFTVFAPTDEAFAKLPKGTLDSLLKDKAKLTAVLTYHVVPGKVKADRVVQKKSIKTVQGQNVRVSTSDGVKVDNARVVKTDIMASNGVIHVIDEVILPKM
jgi:uncharacterized surface protein with fasciclin (FAS1) repeats